MKCPFCANIETQVIDSRINDDSNSIRRRRRCKACSKRFTTFEVAELRMPQIIKNSGHCVPFDAEKLRTSFALALHKRPVSATSIDKSIEQICSKLLQLGVREISSRNLGEMVMEELNKLDKVAYVRFASVYKSFQDVDEFSDAVRKIKQDK